MTRLFAAELLKLRTLRSTWVFLLLALLLAGLVTAGGIGGVAERDRLEPDYQKNLVIDGAVPAVVIGLLVGMILFTNEFRHGTIARTLLATPRRGRLVLVKLLAGAATGIGLAIVTALATAATAVVWLGIVDVPLELGDAAKGVAQVLLGAALAGVLGAAIGGAVHSQVGALVGTLVWLFIAEPIVWVLLGLVDLDGVADYLLTATLFGPVDTEGENLSFAGSVGMAFVWIGAATAFAMFRTTRRDIT
jgi:ABC-2 type transport system permease protein